MAQILTTYNMAQIIHDLEPGKRMKFTGKAKEIVDVLALITEVQDSTGTEFHIGVVQVSQAQFTLHFRKRVLAAELSALGYDGRREVVERADQLAQDRIEDDKTDKWSALAEGLGYQ